MRSTGTVRHWYRDKGWGVLNSTDFPGGCFVHFSHISGTDGFRELFEGETVEFTWEHYPAGQTGYFYRAIEIVRLPRP